LDAREEGLGAVFAQGTLIIHLGMVLKGDQISEHCDSIHTYTQRYTDTDTQTHRHTDTQTHTHTHREGEREGERQRERETERQRDRDRDRNQMCGQTILIPRLTFSLTQPVGRNQ